MDYGIIFVLILFGSVIIFSVLIVWLCKSVQNRKKEEEEELIEYLLSLTPEQREIELKLMEIEAQKNINSTLMWQTFMQNNFKK